MCMNVYVCRVGEKEKKKEEARGRGGKGGGRTGS